MMNSLLILLSVCLAAVSAGLPSATFPKCDKGVLKDIKTYWEGAGIPKGVMQLKGKFSAYKATDGDVFKGAKCRTYEFVDGKTVRVTVDGVVNTIENTEKDGVLIAPTKNTYIISSGDGVIAAYSCSEAADAPEKDLTKAEVTLFVTDKADPDTIALVQGVIKLMGIDLVKDYKCN